jgi:hypothetical protein
MFRIRIILTASTIERAKLVLARGGALLLCVLLVPIAAHASPFDSGISSLQTLFTGTVAKAGLTTRIGERFCSLCGLSAIEKQTALGRLTGLNPIQTAEMVILVWHISN